MTYKFLITLLSSSNEKLLKLVYNTVLNQKNHNLDYTIIIVVNSLNKDYYNDVCKEFETYNVFWSFDIPIPFGRVKFLITNVSTPDFVNLNTPLNGSSFNSSSSFFNNPPGGSVKNKSPFSA